MIITVVAAALSDSNGRLLVQQRPIGKAMAGLWEFPGGKIEEGESPEIALARELQEELGIEVDIANLKPHSFASAPLGEKQMLLLLFGCVDWRKSPEPLHADTIKWVSLDQLASLEMPPADAPLVSALESRSILDLFGGKPG